MSLQMEFNGSWLQGAWPALSVEHVTLDPGAVSSSPMLGMEFPLNQYINKSIHKILKKKKVLAPRVINKNELIELGIQLGSFSRVLFRASRP